MKINRVKWLIAVIMAVPVTLYAVPDTDPVDPANVEDVFLNAFEKIKTGAATTHPEINQISTPANPKSTAAPVRSVKSGVTVPPSSTVSEHNTGISYPAISVKKATSISPAVIHAPAPMQGAESVSDQQIQSELADLRRKNAALQTRVGTMSQQVTQLQQALVESQKLLSKDINTLQSSTLSPHKAQVKAVVLPASVTLPAQQVLPQTVKPNIELPPPQLPQTLLAPAPSAQPPATTEIVPAALPPASEVSTNTTNSQESTPTAVQEEPMSNNFLDSTLFLLLIGVVLMAAGLFLLLWLLWPRSSKKSLSEEVQTPLASPEIASEPEFFPQPEAQSMVKPHTESPEYDAPMKISELESFEQLIEEEQEYLNPHQETESEDMEYSFMDTKDAIPVKLDLARAYLEMGDYEAVNETLKSVFAEGSKAQQREAELLLEQARLAQGD